MEIRENLEDAVLGPFFPNGYVIRLGKSQYFQKWGKKKICCASFPLARCFSTVAAAKRYAERCFWYDGMDPHICQIRWYMANWEGEMTGKPCYWTGESYTYDIDQALSFADYKGASDYQKERGLLEYTYLDFAPFALETLSEAA